MVQISEESDWFVLITAQKWNCSAYVEVDEAEDNFHATPHAFTVPACLNHRAVLYGLMALPH